MLNMVNAGQTRWGVVGRLKGPGTHHCRVRTFSCRRGGVGFPAFSAGAAREANVIQEARFSRRGLSHSLQLAVPLGHDLKGRNSDTMQYHSYRATQHTTRVYCGVSDQTAHGWSEK